MASSGFLDWHCRNNTVSTSPHFYTTQPLMANHQLMSKSNTTLNTTQPKLQPYSQKELREIAGNIEAYRRTLQEEYAWVDHEGYTHIETRMLRGVHNEQLHQIAKDLYNRGARKQKGKAGLTLQVIGQTICQQDPR